MFALHVLASGSKGNAAIVEDASTGRGVLIDCGICKRDFFARCDEAGFDPARLDAVLLTHDHGDHTKGLGVVTRGLARCGARAADVSGGSTGVPPLYMLQPVRRASSEVAKLEDACDIRELATDEVLSFGGISVVAFRTSHDAAASCGFRLESADGDVLGYLTDSGVLTGEAREALQGARILALESNHDVKMLREGPYPYVIKQRVGSDVGHLSNDQAAQALEELLSARLEQVVAMHLSENNNLPSLAERALGDVLSRCGHGARLQCASQRRLVSAR